MTRVTLRQNESQDMLLKRFRKKVVKSGVLSIRLPRAEEDKPRKITVKSA